MTSYDGSISLPRKLTEEETKELRILLLPYFHTNGIAELGPEDIADFLDYAFAMVSNHKAIDFVVQELKGMEMDFCPPEVAEKVGKALSEFLQPLVEHEQPDQGGEREDDGENETGHKVVSLKGSDDKGNALTMSGALGASRQGGRANNDSAEKKHADNRKDSKRGREDRRDRSNRDRGGRGGGRQSERGGRGGRHNERGGRSVQKDAFDRLSRGVRGDREVGRRDGGPERGGGRDGRGHRDGGRGRGPSGSGGRISGNRRRRDVYEDQEFMPMDDSGRGGRGLGGRGRGGRGVPESGSKRPRHDQFEDGYYDDGSGYDGYGYHDGHSSYPQGGRGRGRGGRGRGFPGRGRGGGRFGGRGDPNNNAEATGDSADTGDGMAEGSADQSGGGGGAGHPSPMVQASYSGGRGGFGYSYGGRGRFGGRGGRGRGHAHAGRAHVVSMIQSKTWVRKKDDGSGEPGDDSSPNAEAQG